MPTLSSAKAAMTPPISVPWRSSLKRASSVSTKLRRSMTRSLKSGCSKSIPVSITAIRTPAPRDQRCASSTASERRLDCTCSAALCDGGAGSCASVANWLSACADSTRGSCRSCAMTPSGVLAGGTRNTMQCTPSVVIGHAETWVNP